MTAGARAAVRSERTLSDLALLAELADIAARIGVVESERDDLYARRLALYQDARSRVPPITQQALAEAAGSTEGAVRVALHKASK